MSAALCINETASVWKKQLSSKKVIKLLILIACDFQMFFTFQNEIQVQWPDDYTVSLLHHLKASNISWGTHLTVYMLKCLCWYIVQL